MQCVSGGVLVNSTTNTEIKQVVRVQLIVGKSSNSQYSQSKK